MIIKLEKELIGLMDRKIELLSLYNVASEEIVNSDIEKIAEKFAQRQVLINQIDEISNQIKILVDKQDNEVKVALNDILTYKENNPDVDFKEIYQRAVKCKNILMLVSRCEMKIKTHIQDLKSEMDQAMKKSMSNKKIVDYYNTVTKKVIHGTNFNTLK